MKKHTVSSVIAVSLMVLFVAACQDNKPAAQQTEQQTTMHMAEMMSDSSAVNTMMDHIASNSNMRMTMMQRMIHHTQADSTAMMQMCRTMLNDKEMHAVMMKMMGSAMMDDGSMKQSE